MTGLLRIVGGRRAFPPDLRSNDVAAERAA